MIWRDNDQEQMDLDLVLTVREHVHLHHQMPMYRKDLRNKLPLRRAKVMRYQGNQDVHQELLSF